MHWNVKCLCMWNCGAVHCWDGTWSGIQVAVSFDWQQIPILV